MSEVTLTAVDTDATIQGMLDKRRKWLASCERTLELLTPEWELFETRAGHDTYVARLYADHFSEARTHRKEIAALEATRALSAEVEALRKLAREYRPTMDKEVLHSWAADVAALLNKEPAR
ncbi:hypothetical protein SAMIE_1006000 [Sphingobium amiense]|uniref:Uncharacterized protein n=1 Tax=Sphingobium amiense TaxID=135719 RepID=A0A494WA69_9SPHN|nr:hypothetical protein [Sphingobium amiense]BBD97099.1 hypothetical protein SAMIE_1006000 [Sphingobium amiense]